MKIPHCAENSILSQQTINMKKIPNIDLFIQIDNS